MTQSKEIAAIAEGLTPLEHMWMLDPDEDGEGPHVPDHVAAPLIEKSLVDRVFVCNFLTPLGLAVHKHLEAQQ